MRTRKRLSVFRIPPTLYCVVWPTDQASNCAVNCYRDHHNSCCVLSRCLCSVQFVHVVYNQGCRLKYELRTREFSRTGIWFENFDGDGNEISSARGKGLGIATWEYDGMWQSYRPQNQRRQRRYYKPFSTMSPSCAAACSLPCPACCTFPMARWIRHDGPTDTANTCLCTVVVDAYRPTEHRGPPQQASHRGLYWRSTAPASPGSGRGGLAQLLQRLCCVASPIISLRHAAGRLNAKWF